MTDQNDIYQYLLRLADNGLILGQRLAEWCGHGPVLEQDIAMTNISLDLIGQARNYYSYAAELAGEGKTEDDLAFLRKEMEYQNLLLVERPNGDFANTVLRQYFFDVFHHALLTQLVASKDDKIAAIAQKSIKEVTYHKRWSSQWILRLGDGTEESHIKMQTALDDLWMYAFECLEADDLDQKMLTAGIGADLSLVAEQMKSETTALFSEATLEMPTSTWSQKGGKSGKHSEHLGHLLSVMQYIPRAYPGAKW